MTEPILGAVLAGGESRRFGTSKAAATLDGETLLDRSVRILAATLAQVVVSVSAESDLRWPQVVDRRLGKGPLAGLEAVLEHAAGPVFVLACDLPRVNQAVVLRILQEAGERVASTRGRAWVASVAGVLQPLCGLYAASCLDLVRGQLDRGSLSMHAFLDEVEVVEVDVADLGGDVLVNVNRPAELAAIASPAPGGIVDD